MDNKGYTLAELMIYMIAGVLVLLHTLSVMNQASSTYIHGREVTKIQVNGRDGINVMARDIMNTGFKYYILKDTVDGATTYEFRPEPTSKDSLFLFGSYLSSYNDNSAPADSAASFRHSNGERNDTIEVFRSRLSGTNSIGQVERVSYFVNESVLYRVFTYCREYTANNGQIQWEVADTMVILANVEGLQYQFSIDGKEWISNPTNSSTRDKMKYMKIDLALKSDRHSDIVGTSDVIQIGNTEIEKNGTHLYRVYEQIIPMPNNGILR